MPNYVTNLTPDEKQQLQDIQAETDALFKEYRRIIENIPADGIEAYFGSIDGQARFERIRKLTDRQTHIKENALKREIAAAGTDPDKLFSCAITYLKNVTAFITLDMIYENAPAGVTIISDLSRSLREETALYMQALESCPEYKAKLEAAVRKTAAAYPKVFTVYPDTYITEFDEKIRAADAPTFREQNKGSFFKKTAFGEIYITTKPAKPVKKPDSADTFLYGYTQIMLELVRRPNGILANQAFKTPLEKEALSTYTSTKRGKNAKKYSLVSLFSLDEELKERGIEIKKLGTFNDLVYSVIYSIWYQECIINKKKFAIIYPENLYRNINHLDNHASVPDGAVEKIEKAIEIFRGTTVKANVTDMLNEWGLDQTVGRIITNGIIDQKMLVATGAEFSLQSGNKVKGYYVSKANEPILGAFSRCLKEITRIPAEMLTCEDKDNSIERTSIRYYLANAVQTMRYNPKFSRTVRLDPLYKDILGKSIEELSKDKRRKLKNYITSYLDYLKKSGHIVDYEYQKDGRTISAISFTVNPLKQDDK